MSNNNTILPNTSNIAPAHEDAIHKLISCENIKNLAASHSELCNGIYAVLNGGSDFTEIEPLFHRLIDQSSEIELLINVKLSLESEHVN
ncbi:hypothetical protein FQP81_00510 [Pseudoalteromonas distincta]|uniref:hypothetical protein n=1 Tax=Pseudoalteromonas distincta TaxID=77608 RepID=UPI0011945D1E|nr:hypothetical protein [Pseudoalteromonas elyakovii]TVU77943.1 hypothetical protein FQP81_00510 [Pseudoalteromonas elyakovii]|tara:strand:+ start:99 stop:365 length:267 start_codon:yes stop_codon:yes gene_type:complete